MTQKKPSVLTVILNYKTAAMTLKSIAAAYRAMDGIAGEIIVVDNDSQDGSFAVLQDGIAKNGWDADNRVRVVASPKNGGFGAGNNFGILSGLSNGTRPDYIYVLNSDAFPAHDAIAVLFNYLQDHKSVGFAGSYIHGEDGAPHVTTFRFPTISSEFEGAIRFGPVSRLLSKHRVPVDIPDTAQAVDWLAGASMMMRTDVLETIGLFDETFFLYFEETDLCRRARFAGWPTHYVVDSKVAHIGSVSTGMKTWTRMPQYWFASRLYYFTKNHGGLYSFGATFAHIVGGLLYRLRQVIQCKPRVDPKWFLTDFTLHAAKSIFTAKKHPPTLTYTPAKQDIP